MSISYIGYTNNTLRLLPDVEPGDEIDCACGKRHILEAASDGSTILMFYRCNGELRLGAVNKKMIVRQRVDLSGKLE